ncbi:MAG: phosphate ABC transporter substrate-binding protein PstS [Cyanobacteriota bacterium]|jgi:phosphate transport system substrate-binding protein
MLPPITGFRRPLAGMLAIGLAGSLLSACGGSTTLNGAGASFPAAIYQHWFQQLSAKGVNVNYQSVGSGAGVRQFEAGTVDFAASDVPMKAEDVAKVSRGVVQVPMTAGAIAVAYNLQGCTLKLTQSQLVDIFLGRITDFRQLGCAARPIRVVHRSDGSGTTANFTAHLSAVSPAWKAGPGNGKTVKWPTGIGAKGNEGVAAQLGQVEGSIGYVEAAYVRGNLQAAALTNASGELTTPTSTNAAEALAAIDLGPSLVGSDPNPVRGYPIVTFSWILLYKQGNGAKLEPLQRTFENTLSAAFQAEAPKLGFVSLPPAVAARGLEALKTLAP